MIRRAVSSALFALAVGVASGVAFAQTCNSSITDEMPDSRYEANSNGTAVDLQTGLMWMRCALGQTWDAQNSKCSGSAVTYTWQSALQAAQSLNQGGGYAGYTDWRLPNLRELMSIDRYHCTKPTINLDIFPETPSQAFWSSSPLELSGSNMWTLNFGSGQAVYDVLTASYAVRLVRAGAFQ